MTKEGKEKHEDRAHARSSVLTHTANVMRSSAGDLFCNVRDDHASFPHPLRRKGQRGMSLSAPQLLADREKLSRSSQQIN